MPKKPASNKWYMGIDPGQSGGIVIVDSEGLIAEYFLMPDTVGDLWQLFKTLSDTGNIRACTIEKVQSRPGEGHKGAFTFGWGAGCLEMGATAAELCFQLVTPREWQKNLNIVAKKKAEVKHQFKDRLREFSQRLYPKLDIWQQPRTLGKQRAICDALLIAEYTRRKYEGLLK